MATLFVRHTVTDFDAWKKVYDAFDAERRSLGVTSHGVYQRDGSLQEVTVYHEFDSVEAARAFAGNPRLKEVMQAAGVQGTADIWITSRV
jgi:hypothetical protein